ncbi:ANTAR domain-containing protein [Rhodococcus sp. NPDC059968]|uniref:ANTAR domain-containing protein n=1 Tax=Rhodococcus sp. NPDC059968 TaxID=3347017 RepID=UPI00366F1F3A
MPEPDSITRQAGVGVHRARDGRETLSVAEGILIARRRCSQIDAFEELLRVANRHHLSVLTVAHALVDLAIDAHPPLGSPERHTPPERWPSGRHISHIGQDLLGNAT